MIKKNKILVTEFKTGKYTKKEFNYAINYLNTFLEKLNSLFIVENGIKRELNELEKIICIYDFVTNRNYNNKKKYSQDIIGAINYDCFVCMTFSKMIKILCDEINIPCMIKYSYVTPGSGYHANNEVVITDKIGHAHMLHLDATQDCLNHSIHSFGKYINYDSISRINGLLILNEDINKYHKHQILEDKQSQTVYFKLLNKIEPDRIFEVTDSDKYIYESYVDMMLDKIDYLTPNLMEMCEWFGIDCKINTEAEIIETYRRLQEIFNIVNIPISFDEILEAMYNAYYSLLIYDGYEGNIDKEVNLKILKKLQISLEFQIKNYNNEQGKSFMFTIANNTLRNIRRD